MTERRFDVAVVGGGLAGVAAGIAAARAGARALLVEQADELGGNVSQAWVHTLCGLYLPRAPGDAHEPSPRWANHGLPREFAEGLHRAGAAGEPEWAGRVAVLPSDPVRVGRHARELCAGTPGLVVRTGCRLTRARLAADAGGECELGLAGPEGDESVRASAVVDASGDGNLTALAGAGFVVEAGSGLQSPSFIFRLSQVAPGAAVGFERLKLTVAVAGAARRGDLPAGCESVLVRPASSPDEVFVTLNLPDLEESSFGAFDPLDAGYLEALGKAARESARRVAGFLASARPEFARCRVAGFAPRVGVREGRRLDGRETLSESDVLEGRRSEDDVALSAWPIELWRDHRRAELRHPAAPCGIRLGALASRSHPTLGAAGRCISASHEALGAVRVLGTALATGEAVGVAAAVAADLGCALGDVEAARVRDTIARWSRGGPSRSGPSST